jgi:flagellar motor switch protein FliM
MNGSGQENQTQTQPTRPAAPHLPRREVRPFAWERLPRLARAQLHLVQKLGLPPDAAGLLRQVAFDLNQDLKAPVDLVLEGFAWREPPARLSEPGCFALVDLPPLPEPAEIDLDLGLALAATDRLLGGPGESPPVLRPLSPIERGTLSYLLLRALARLDQGWMRAAGLRPRLRGVFATGVAPTASFVEVVLAASIAEARGTVRLWLPAALATSEVLSARRRRALPGPLRGLALEVVVEAARTWLYEDEIRRLAPRDIVVCETARVHLGPSGIEGEVDLRVHGAPTSMDAMVAPTAGGFQLSLGGIRGEGEKRMSNDSIQPTGEDLLAQAQIPAIVELGRLTMTAEEIAALRPGDTLLLGRSPTGGVELTVGGRIIAWGELVDVEGELGFRVARMRG